MKRFMAVATVGAIAVLAGCNAVTTTTPAGPTSHGDRRPVNGPAIQTPALLGVTFKGELEYYVIKPDGGSSPVPITQVPNLSGAAAMVGHFHEVAIVAQNPPGVVLYNVATQAESILPDPYGTPIDIAIDKNANLFVLNFNSSNGNVTMFRAGSTKPIELGCQQIGIGEDIAANNEGDVFVNGITQSTVGVVKIPHGPHGPIGKLCKLLALQPEQGYVAGIAVDPKTDDLIVMDDPDECAGSDEGRMTIYPKPYHASTGHSVTLRGNCIGRMRLDATSTIVFTFDQTVSGGMTYVTQHSYPGGVDMGSYTGGNLSGITTIPNRLPN
jgi:hypothetical protein